MPLVVASLLLILLPLLVGVSFYGQPGLMVLLYLPMIAAIFGVAYLRTRFPIRQRGVVTVKDDVLLLDGEPLLAQQNIRGIFPVVGAENAVLIAERGLRSFRATTIELASREDANALRNDLKWDEAQAAQEFSLISGRAQRIPWWSLIATAVIVFVLLFANIQFHLDPRFFLPILFAGFVIGLISIVTATMRNMVTRVRVGTDGLRVKSRGKNRFISYREVLAVTYTETEVTLELISDESLTWSHGEPGPISTLTRKLNPVSQTDALFERIENARAWFSTRAEIRSHLLSALKRDGRSLEEWRVAATSLSHEHYRVAATPRDVLENIVQDSAVAPDVRIGAAIALHADAGSRLRVGTETSALPELGKAIDAALDGDDPALEKAIATLKLEA